MSKLIAEKKENLNGCKTRSSLVTSLTQLGASLVEMALLISLIALIGFASISQVGLKVKCSFYRGVSGFTVNYSGGGMSSEAANECCPNLGYGSISCTTQGVCYCT